MTGITLALLVICTGLVAIIIFQKRSYQAHLKEMKMRYERKSLPYRRQRWIEVLNSLNTKVRKAETEQSEGRSKDSV